MSLYPYQTEKQPLNKHTNLANVREKKKNCQDFNLPLITWAWIILCFSVDFNFFFVVVLFHFICLLVLQHIIVEHLVHTNLASRCIWNTAVNRSRKVYGGSWHSMFCGPTWIPLPIFVNKVLSEHSCAYLFTDGLWLLLCNKGRVE